MTGSYPIILLYNNIHYTSSLSTTRLRDKTNGEAFGLRDKLGNNYLGNESEELAKYVDLVAFVLGLSSGLKVNGSKEEKYYLCIFLTPGFIRKISCHWTKFKVTS